MSAESLYSKAEGKLRGWFSKDYFGAMELFSEAAARFKIDKNYRRAGEAYERSAKCALKSDDKIAASRMYASAVGAYKKIDIGKAAEALETAVNMHIENNSLSSAARLEKEFADALCEHGNSMDAISHYEKALQYFNAEDMKVQARSCTVAIAKIYGENDMFEKALSHYELLGSLSAEGPLQFEAKEFYMRAMLCRFALVKNDNRYEKGTEATEALKTYTGLCRHLKNTREEEFLQKCAEAVEECDVDKFEAAVSLLADLRMLDDWKTHVLLVVKRNMESIQ